MYIIPSVRPKVPDYKNSPLFSLRYAMSILTRVCLYTSVELVYCENIPVCVFFFLRFLFPKLRAWAVELIFG